MKRLSAEQRHYQPGLAVADYHIRLHPTFGLFRKVSLFSKLRLKYDRGIPVLTSCARGERRI